MTNKQMEPDVDPRREQEKRPRKANRNKKVGAFAVAAAICLAACSGPGDAGPVENATTPADEAPTVNSAEAGAEAVGTVTFDGSTCSMEITADRIEPGVVSFEVVNGSEQSVMFDSWQILEGYTFRQFETAVERARRLAEAGKPYPSQGGPFPDQETEVQYLQSDVVPANGSGSIVTTMSPGPHAIACLQRFEGAHGSFRGRQPYGIAGPIVVR